MISSDHDKSRRKQVIEEKLTAKIFIRKVVEVGVFHGINEIFNKYWKYN
jgi:hypothetical protein